MHQLSPPSLNGYSIIEMARQPQESSEDTQSEHSAVPERDSYLARAVAWLKEEDSSWVQCNVMNITGISVFSLGSFISARTGGKMSDGIMQPSLSGDIVSGTSLLIGSLLTLKTAYQIRKARTSSDPDVRSNSCILHKIANWQILIGIAGLACGVSALFIYPTKEDKN